LLRAGLPAAVILLAACTPTRTLTVRSNPSGAAVRVDGSAVGTTPVVMPFEHHGTRRVTLYLEGYLVWSEAVPIEAPWWAGFPLDLVTENLVPWRLRDEHELAVPLTPAADRPGVEGIDAFLQRTTTTHVRERRAAKTTGQAPEPVEEPRP
jgi:hypothetical protein